MSARPRMASAAHWTFKAAEGRKPMGSRYRLRIVAGMAVAVAAAASGVYLAAYAPSSARQPRNDCDAPSPSAFAESVRERLLIRYADLHVTLERDGRRYTLVVTRQSSTTRAPLQELHRSVVKSPHRSTELVDDFLARTVEGLSHTRAETLDQVRYRLLPMVKPKVFVAEQNCGDDREVKVPWKALPNQLVVCFVIDYADHVRYVTIGDLHRWQRTLKDVKIRATRNLWARTEGIPMGVSKNEHGEVYFHQHGDGYDAARILVLQWQRAAPDSIWTEDLIVAIPDRDRLIATPLSHVEVMRALLPRIKQDASSSRYRLTNGLFRVGPSRIKAYTLPPG